MVNCPHCGTANQDGSEFCRECGQPLSTRNPLLSQDTSGDIPEEMPVWLEELLIAQGLSKPEPEKPEPRPAGRRDESLLEREPEEPAAVTEAESEDWLATLRSRGDEPPSEEVAPLPTDEGDFDWLRSLRESDSEVESREGPSEDVGLRAEPPEWLRDLGGPGEEAMPTPPAGTGAPPAGTDAPSLEMPEAGDEELPEWLRDLGGPGEEAMPTPPAGTGAPPVGTGAPPAGTGAPPAGTVAPSLEMPEAKDEELPEWLRDLGGPGEEATPAPPAGTVAPPAGTGAPPVGTGAPSLEMPEAEDEGLPEWLRDLGGPGEEATPAPPAGTVAPPAGTDAPSLEMPEAKDEGLPEWLRDLGGPGEEATPAPPAEVPDAPVAGLPVEGTGEAEEEKGPGVEMPQWLQEVQREEPVLAEEEGLPPDWLAQPTTSDASVETDESPIPEWLKGPSSSPSDVIVEEKESAPPDWLQEVSAALPREAGAEEQPSAEVPSWLQELRPSAETPGPAVEEEMLPPEGEGRGEDLELPSREAPVEETEKPKGEPEEGGEGLAAADIPDWLLSLRPGKEGEEPPGEPELMELSGPLAGIRGVLPVEPLISFPHLTRPEKVPIKVPSVSGDLLAEVVAQPPVQAAPVPRRKDERIVAGVQRVLIYLLVLAAVVVPLLMGPIYGPLDAADLRGGAETFYPLLDGQGAVALPADSVVVVAFDYKPAMAAELSLQARAILDHLMRRGVRIMAISLYPEGAALASEIVDEVAAAHGYIYGENYIHLGYLPDQPASVRYFLNAGPAGNGWKDYREGQPISQYPIAQGVGNLSAVKLVIELAGNERTLQTWVEQMSARTKVPLAAGVSAATLPYAQPYLDSGQLRALLVGLPGAVEYEARIGRAGDATNSLGSQVAAQASIVLLILLGNLVHLVSRGGKK